MALNMRQDLRMSQQLVMTPQLQQAIKLLQLSRVELSDLVRDELLENPLLEEAAEIGTSTEVQESTVEIQEGVEHERDAPPERTKEVADEVKVETVSKDDFDWEGYLENASYLPPGSATIRRDGDELPSYEATLSAPETLDEHLRWQVRLSNYNEREEEIADFLIGCYSTRGYLEEISVPQIARQLGRSNLEVEQVLRKVQLLDPVASGARNLAECLWIQARHPEHPIEDPLVLGIISKHLHNLETRKYNTVARDLGEPLEEVYEATKVVMGLDPRPARAYAADASQYITPDVYIIKVGDEFIVTLNDDGMPKLQITKRYSDMYRSATENNKAREYIHERLRSAQWLIRSIQQRQRTILKVTKSILNFQREFFEKGPQHLRPLILKDVAEDIEMHESTVSRVTTNKYVHTPQGIFELKYFFNAGISRKDGDELASEAVKTKIKKLIDHEDPTAPLSDQKLVECLREEGIRIARRTVAKYREQLNVLSSSKRRKLF
ncbi:MAG: RNA polymerase factor sigma-54 [Myxococcales bacterium]|nr:RNA polymerase factor sigma-54 [Myxococcales bacterium]